MAAPDPPLDDAALDAIAARKWAELEHKLRGIREEFARWLGEAGAKRPLRKHQSQLTRLFDQLGGMADAVADRLGALGDSPAEVLGQARVLQLRLLEVHRLWDYYRVKFNLRYVAWFRDYLAAADDLAWECYEPARTAAGSAAEIERRRAAPLVFLSGDFSPYTHARATQYEVDSAPGVLSSEEFRKVAAELPVPVIGVPWLHVSHLPDAPLIGHEIGHDLEAELDLTDGIQAHAAPVLEALRDEDRAYTWTQWLPEVHADLVGLMCTGRAFANAMLDLLAADPLQVADESRLSAAWLAHPPATLRMLALAHALNLQGLADDGAAVRDAWEEAFPAMPRDRFRNDVPAVVEALWHGEHDQLGGTLAAALGFDARLQRAALTVCETVKLGFAATSTDVRALVAGARLAYDAEPERYDKSRGPSKKTPQQLVLDRILELRDDAPRAAELAASPGHDADRAAGRALFERFSAELAARTTAEGRQMT